MSKGQIKQKQDRIKKEQFESLCYIQCTEEEICSVLDVCTDTLDSWCQNTYGMHFSDIFKIKRKGGRASLRRNQWKLAEKNATMAIFLGKQYLGQKDVIETTVTNNGILDELVGAIKDAKKDR